MIGYKMTEITHKIIEKYKNIRNIVVNAKVGNGNDTLFLAKQVGETGKVYGFDIQKLALDNTIHLLKNNNINQNVQLFLEDHSNMKKYVNEKIKACMFNLGYLPGGDVSVITKKTSTIKAVQHSLELLDVRGIISILCYYGHNGGIEEKESLEELLFKLPAKSYDVMDMKYFNRSNNPPILYIITKKHKI